MLPLLKACDQWKHVFANDAILCPSGEKLVRPPSSTVREGEHGMKYVVFEFRCWHNLRLLLESACSCRVFRTFFPGTTVTQNTKTVFLYDLIMKAVIVFRASECYRIFHRISTNVYLVLTSTFCSLPAAGLSRALGSGARRRPARTPRRMCGPWERPVVRDPGFKVASNPGRGILSS